MRLLHVSWFCLLLSTASFIMAQTTVNTQVFMSDYEGTINNKLPIRLHLVNWGTGTLTGNYFYKKVGTKINLYGEFTSENTFQIKEYVGDEHTGTFEGTFSGTEKISGTWSNPQGTRRFPFQVTLQKNVADASGWTGAWHLNDVWDNGTLLIGNVRADSLDFAISVFRAGHMGEVEGTAARMGKQAKFAVNVMNLEEDEKCRLSFTLASDHIEVAQESYGSACGFGMRASADGKFDKKKLDLKPTIAYGTDKVFANKAQHDGFYALVGSKMYELFAFNLQGYEQQPQEPNDGFQATAVVGAASGLYRSNEAIILYDGRGKYWAATLDFADDQGLIRYFSNDDKFKKKMPATIEAWAERFEGYKVVYN